MSECEHSDLIYSFCLACELSKREKLCITLESQLADARAMLEKMVKALKAQAQMRDMSKPQKLDEALSWRDNDDLAKKWTEDALASYKEWKKK